MIPNSLVLLHLYFFFCCDHPHYQSDLLLLLVYDWFVLQHVLRSSMIYALQSNIWFLVFASLWIKKPAMFLLPCSGITFLVCSPDAINCPCCIAFCWTHIIAEVSFNGHGCLQLIALTRALYHTRRCRLPWKSKWNWWRRWKLCSTDRLALG